MNLVLTKLIPFSCTLLVALSSLTSSLSMLSVYWSGMLPSTQSRVTDRLTNRTAAMRTMQAKAMDLSSSLTWTLWTEQMEVSSMSLMSSMSPWGEGWQEGSRKLWLGATNVSTLSLKLGKDDTLWQDDFTEG